MSKRVIFEELAELGPELVQRLALALLTID
jgi:hypothetical protein